MRLWSYVIVWLCAAGCISASAGNVLHFDQAWVWQYCDSEGQKHELVAYYHSDLHYWLLTAEAYGISGEQCDWILARPDGTYLTAYRDEQGKPALLRQHIDFPQIKKIPPSYQPLPDYRTYGRADMGFPLRKGQAYRKTFLKTETVSTVYCTRTTIDFRPLYYFNRLPAEAKLPIEFPTDIPPVMLVLEEHIEQPGWSVCYRFTEQSHTVYEIDLSLYTTP